MAEAKEPKEKKNGRGRGRNTDRRLADLKMYCEVSIETLKDSGGFEQIDGSLGLSAVSQGKVAAFERVLQKINGGAQ